MNRWSIVALVAAFLACLPLLIQGVFSVVLHCFDPRWLLGKEAAQDQMALRLRIVRIFLRAMSITMHVGPTLTSRDTFICSASFYEKPFVVEGSCAGLSLAYSLSPWQTRSSFGRFCAEYRQFEFLQIIGLGFAAGIADILHLRSIPPDQFVPSNLRTLWADGFGFQHTIFLYRRGTGIPAIISRANRVKCEGYFEGVGRALWFLLPSAQSLSRVVGSFPASTAWELAIGYGIAAGFAGCLQLERSFAETGQLPIVLRSEYKIGMLVGLFARNYIDSVAFREMVVNQGFDIILPLVIDAANLYHEAFDHHGDYQIWRERLRHLADSQHFSSESKRPRILYGDVRHG
jgi:hypothetical protein